MPDYELNLYQLGTSGFGTVVQSDLLTTYGVDPGSAGLQGTQPLTYGYGLNGAGTLTFTLPVFSPAGGYPSASDFAPGQREVGLKRDGTLVWGGRLWSAELLSQYFVRFTCEGWYSTLRIREIGDDFYYTATDELDIAWNAISYTQAKTGGNLGITRGSATTAGINRKVVACAEERKLVSDVIESLAGTNNGFDFWVDPGKVWRTYHPSRGADLSGSVVLDASTNLQVLLYTRDATTVRNSIASIGPVSGCEDIHYNTYSDSTSISAFGLLEGNNTRSDLNDTDWIDAQTQEILRVNKTERITPRVEYLLGSGVPRPDTDYNVGDVIRVKASRGWATFDRNFRVVGYDVHVAPSGFESAVLDLDGAI